MPLGQIIFGSEVYDYFFAITVADEFFEFKRLINSLQPYIYPQEEIVILADENKVTQEIKDHCDLWD